MTKIVKYELQEKIDKIIKLREEGMYQKDIAKLFNTSTSSIGRILRENNVWHRFKLTKEDIESIKKLYSSGTAINVIARQYHKSENTIRDIIDSSGLLQTNSHRHQIYEINENYFDKIDCQEKAYIIGLFMADGCVYKNNLTISLQENDKHILDTINSLIGSNRPLKFIDYNSKNSNYSNQYCLQITNEHLVSRLKELGVVERKSLILEYPEWLDDSLFPHFLRGMIDGDGCLEWKRCRVSLVGANKMMLQIKDKISHILHIDVSVRPHYCNNNVSNLVIGNKINTKILLDYIYKDATIFLNRKHNIYLQYYINNSLTA